jgi:hypothetical protein
VSGQRKGGMTPSIGTRRSHRIGQTLRRVPFTLLTLTLIVAFGIATHSPLHHLPLSSLRHLSYAPTDVSHPADWWRLAASAGPTEGGRAFWEALLGVAFFVGVAEWRAGTVWAAATFWGAHLGALLVESLAIALPFAWLHLPLGDDLAASSGVGASAGYLGSLGLVVATLPRRWSYRAAGAILVLLIVLIVIPVGQDDARAVWLTDGICHLLAFCIGFGSREWWRRKQPPRHPGPDDPARAGRSSS